MTDQQEASSTPRRMESARPRLPAAGAWLAWPSERPDAHRRLFCFPYAGAGASVYRAWSSHVPATLEIFAMQPSGREGRWREEPLARVEDMVEAAVGALQVHVERPFALFGHSLGALVAFEVARSLAARKQALPLHLFVSGQSAPHLPKRQVPIAHLPREAFVAEVRRRYDGIPEEVLRTPELMDLLVPGLRADMSAFEGYTYVPGPPVGCPVTAYGGSEDPDATRAEIRSWQVHTEVAFRDMIFPGNHFFVQTSLGLLAEDVVKSLACEERSGESDGRT